MKSIVKGHNLYFVTVASMAFLLTCAGAGWAPLVNQFQPGTTIRAQEMNDNFSNVVAALPGIKDANSAGGPLLLTTSPQTVVSITLTPPADGTFLIFGSAQVSFHLQPGDGSLANFFISTTPNSDSGGCGYAGFKDPGSTGGPFLTLPVSMITSLGSVTKNVPVTYYMSASRGTVENQASTVTVVQAVLYALFAPTYLQ